MYIYENENWPKFSWEHANVDNLLIAVRYEQGRLIGGMESIEFRKRDATVLENLTQSVIKSSEIEGEILDTSLVRSSVARHLGLEVAGLDVRDAQVDGVVEMVLDAAQEYDKPLTQERLFGWHASLFPTGRSGFSKVRVGAWRTGSVEVVSGRMGREIVHFKGPPAENIDHEMNLFLNWVNRPEPIDLVLKAAIAHLWFVTLHPFDDGNGRIGRAIVDLLLARSEKTSNRFYSLSSQIQKDRKEYYEMLESTQKGSMDITPWIEWFFGCFRRAIQCALSDLNLILDKEKFWEQHADLVLNPRQKKVINLLLVGFEGKLTTSKWAKIAKCSQDTAYRDILCLIELGIISKNPDGGRSTSYSLV